jgi:hypothetical protein
LGREYYYINLTETTLLLIIEMPPPTTINNSDGYHNNYRELVIVVLHLHGRRAANRVIGPGKMYVTRTKRIRNRRAPLLFLLLLLLLLLIARTRQHRCCSRTITKILLSRIVMMRCNGHFNHDYNSYFIARPTVSWTKRKNNAKRVSVQHEIEKG